MPKYVPWSTLALSAILVVACGGTPKLKLTPISEAIPADVSLAGNWELREEEDEASRRIREAEQQAAGRIDDAISQSRKEKSGKNSRSKKSSNVHVFLETGRRLKITQTSDGLFVSFDRSVVEEYRFREHRYVNVGPIAAERVSGWQDGKYVILTLDEQGALLTETYALLEDGAALERTIRIVFKEKETLSARQVFDRTG